MRSPIIKAAALFLICLLVFTACAPSGESSKKERTTMMTVGGYEVSYELYRYALRNAEDTYVAANGALPENETERSKAEAEIRDSALGAIKNMFAVLAACDKYDIHIDDQLIKDKVTSRVALEKEEYDSEKSFLSALTAAHMNKSVFSFLTGVQYCQDELYYAMIKAGDISIDEDYIKSVINSDEFIRVKQVLIKFDVDDDGRDDGKHEERYATAEKVRALAAAGEDFDSLVMTYGNDMFMFNNPDGYYMIRGVNYTAFEDAAFALSIGEISPVVETPVGYSVIMRFEKDPAYIESHYESLASDYAASVFSLTIEGMIGSLDVKTADAYEKYGFSDIK